MQLPTSAQGVYSDWWQLATYAAAQRDTQGDYTYTVTDLSSAARDISTAQGSPLAFQDYNGLASLFGVARTMERRADSLTGASTDDNIDSSMVSEAPWSRSYAEQNAAPKWQLRAEITYRAPDGSVTTTWGTGVFQNTLHSTVGQMRDEAWLQFQRMLGKRSEQRNTGGELLSIGRQYLMAV